MAFSATDAAFEGFRVVRRTPMTLVWWSLFYLVFLVLIFVLAGGSVVALMNVAESLRGNPNPSPEELQPMFAAYGVIFAVVLPLSIVASAVLYGAANRAVLRPEENRFGYLRFGMDEVRLFVVSLVLTLLAILVFGLLAAVVGGVAGGVGAGVSGPAGVIAGVIGFIAFFCVVIWLSVRLSLAAPITFAERRIAIFDSWGLTKGRFWPLFGMALIAVAMSIVVSLLAQLVFTGLALAVGGFGQLTTMEEFDLNLILTTMLPAAVLYLIFMAVSSALQMSILYCPFAAAYRDIKGVSNPATAETFA